MKLSGLRGRGGAGFPAATKWSFLPPDSFPRYLVVNGDEGEPSTFKDRMLVERDPHQLVEGIAISAYAVQCNLAFVYIRGEFALGYERLMQAIADANAKGFLGKNILGSGFDLDIVVHRGAGAYICGEETALLEILEGERGMPRIRPPFPAIAGLYAKPTVINNVETLSTVPHIIAMGGAEYGELGVNRSTGTRFFSVSGHVKSPATTRSSSAYVPRSDLRPRAAAFATTRQVKFFIPGGASCQWLTGRDEHLDAPLDMDYVQQTFGVMLGSGAVMVFDETTDPVLVAWRLAKFFAHERAASARRAARERAGSRRCSTACPTARAGPATSTCCSTSATTSRPVSSNAPFTQTTICPLGPACVADRQPAQVLQGRDRGAHCGADRRIHAGDRRPNRRPERARTPSTVTVDGMTVEAAKGELLIKAAQEHGTYIPRFCWHERMKPVGMCRMCLVEVEGVRGFPPACTTPVAEGMVVTRSPTT